MIRPDDRVATIIRDDESMIDVFASLSPAFERLRNPAMRKVMARLVTVEQAARMAGVNAAELVERLNAHLNGEPYRDAGDGPNGDPHGDVEPDRDNDSRAAPRGAGEAEWRGGAGAVATRVEPAALARIPAERRIVLDVREDLRAGNEPFRAIMSALRERRADGALAVRAIFEPVPLYAVMRNHGLVHYTEQLGVEDWRVWFYPDGGEPAGAVEVAAPAAHAQPAAPPNTNVPAAHAQPAAPPDVSAPAADAQPTGELGGGDVVVLDVRGLEPPEPMMRTLAALEQLPQGGTLVQLNARVPQFLLPLLEERGFTYTVREQQVDLVRVFIRRTTA